MHLWYNVGTLMPFILYLNIICLGPSLACYTKGLEAALYGDGTNLYLILSRNS